MDPFWAKKIFPENLALSQITLYGFLAPRQIKKKKTKMEDRPCFTGLFQLLPGVQKLYKA